MSAECRIITDGLLLSDIASVVKHKGSFSCALSYLADKGQRAPGAYRYGVLTTFPQGVAGNGSAFVFCMRQKVDKGTGPKPLSSLVLELEYYGNSARIIKG